MSTCWKSAAISLFTLVAPLLRAADSVAVFNELHYHPFNETTESEWVELRSFQSVDVDISGWRIDGGIDFTFPPGTILPGGGYLVVATVPGQIPGALGPFAGQLSNAGETLRLRNRMDRIMDELTYGDGGDWPTSPDGTGVTLARRVNHAGEGAEHWAASLEIGGTPGLKNFAEAGDPPIVQSLVALGSSWKYRDVNTAPPSDWAAAAHNDAAWPSGPALLHAGSPNVTGAGEGLLGYWPLSATSGTVAANLAPGGTAGTLFNGATWVNDASRGQVLALDGADGYVSAGTLPRMTLTNNFTWSFWAYSQQASGNVVVGNRYSPSGTDWSPREFIKFTPQSFQFDYNSVQHVDYSDMPSATWVHHAMVKQGNVFTYYRNGAVANSISVGSGQNNPQPLYFGGDKTLENWAGRLDDVAVWTKALAPDAIAGLANGTYTPLTAPTGGSAIPLATAVALGSPAHYFRTSFTWNGNPALANLGLRHVLDDGAVFHLNGTEIARVNMPAGTVAHATPASAAVTSSSLSAEIPVSNAALVNGPNVLAVEVHQHTANNDMVFGASLVSTRTAVPAVQAVELSEIAAAADTNFFVEVRNRTAAPVDAAGYQLRTSAGSVHALPPVMIPAGGFASFSRAALGLTPVDGLRVALFSAAAQEHQDGREITSRLRGLSPDGKWGYPAAPTPGAANSTALSTAIVINEIFYQAAPPAFPAPPTGEQWIELHNRGGAPVDVSGWAFTDGVDFTIPAATPAIPAGGFLVVAWDPAAFATLHPGRTALGPFAGSLSGSGERIVLRDAFGNVADEVHYRDGGRWSAWADGGGSSLELIDPDADNAAAEAWDASDESARSTWQTVSYGGVAANNPANNPTTWNEFLFGLLNAGEFLIDDIVVTDTTAGTGNLVQNGGFSGGNANFWRVIGTHSGTVIDDPLSPGNKVLKVTAVAETEHMHNHAGTTLKNGASFHTIAAGDTYSVSFRAKWVRGSNALHSRLYTNRLPRKTLLNRPVSGGTPGAVNSRLQANLGPTHEDLAHDPAVPAASQSVTVSVRASDPDGIAALQLFTSVAGGAFTSTAMTAGGGGVYTGMIPGQSAGTVVQFYLQATDNAGAVSFFPAGGASSRALVQWDDGRDQLTLASGAKPLNLRVIMTGADANTLYRHENLMSNAGLPATVIVNERDIHYGVGVALKSSEHGRSNVNRVGYNLDFPADKPFLGRHRSVSIDRSGGTVNGQREMLLKTLMNLAGGIHAPEDDLIRLIPATATGSGFAFDGTGMLGAAILSKTRLKRDYLDAQWDNGGDGMMFKYERIYVLTQTINPGTRVVDASIVPENPKIPQDTTGPPGVAVSSLGSDPEAYRWHWLVESGRDADDYSGLMNVVNAIGQTGGTTNFNVLVDQHINVDAWLRAFIPGTLYGTQDNYMSPAGGGAMHNALFYFPPGHKALILPWDQDYLNQVNPTTTSLANGGDIPKFLANPVWKRLYYSHMLDVLNRSFNTATMSRWAGHYSRFGTDDMTASVVNYLTPRANYARDVINGANGQTAPIPAVAFTRTSPSPVTVSTPFATVSGDGWINIQSIRLAGSTEPLALVWTDENSWSVQVPVSLGTQTRTLEALDGNGVVLGTVSVTITGTGSIQPAGPGHLVLSELHFNPAGAGDDTEFIELLNVSASTLELQGCHFDEVLGQGIAYLFSAPVPLAPGGRIVVARSRAAFQNAYPSAAAFLASGEFNPSALDNGGERIVLFSAAGQVILDVTYDDNLNPADGGGRSLVRVAPSTNPGATSLVWRVSTTDGGNPGGGDALAFAGAVNADADGDGLPALLEYALGLDDTVPNATPFQVQMNGSGDALVSFSRQVNADDALLALEVTTLLPGGWSAAVAEKIADSTLGLIRSETWRVTTPPGASRLYVRLRADLR